MTTLLSQKYVGWYEDVHMQIGARSHHKAQTLVRLLNQTQVITCISVVMMQTT